MNRDWLELQYLQQIYRYIHMFTKRWPHGDRYILLIVYIAKAIYLSTYMRQPFCKMGKRIRNSFDKKIRKKE